MRPRTRIARRLRRDATEVEKRLWRALGELGSPYRFRRQHPVGRYVVDFACPGLKLAIELDGGQHAGQEEADAARTSDISRHGYRVIRFWNGDVVNNLSGVLELIQHELKAGCVGEPSPPFRAGREGPTAKPWEGEVGIGERSGIPHLTPALSAPEGGEGVRRAARRA